MEENGIVTNITDKYDNLVRLFHIQIIQDALAMLNDDMHLTQRTSDSEIYQSDGFITRANQIVIALHKYGFASGSEKMLRGLIQETQKYDQKTGERHNLSTLYANTALACIAQGNYDQGIVEFLSAIRENEEHKSTSKNENIEIKNILNEVFDLTRNDILEVVHTIDPEISIQDIKNIEGMLTNDQVYALIAYLDQVAKHIDINKETPNEFSQMQIFSAIRNLSCLFEVELKTLLGNMNVTLFPAIKNLFEQKSWWNEFDRTRKRIKNGDANESPRPIDDQLADAIALEDSSPEMLFWKSLIVSYVIRNYTVHQLETNCALVQIYSQNALAYLVYAITKAPSYC